MIGTRSCLSGAKSFNACSNERITIVSNINEYIDTKKSTQRHRFFSLRIPRPSLRVLLFSFFTTCSIAILLLLFVPAAYYTLFPLDPIPVKTDEAGTPQGGSFTTPQTIAKKERSLPPYDATLPEGNWLIIPRIGVQTELLESAKPDESLAKGVWRVPDFGLPGDTTKPMILAAHRFGYKWWWNSSYWRYHSFYLLPTLQPGDLVEVISNKRKYTYEIYAGEQGEQITDYNADLILYTCKFLQSPIRHFRYARLIDPTTNTQHVDKTPSPLQSLLISESSSR